MRPAASRDGPEPGRVSRGSRPGAARWARLGGWLLRPTVVVPLVVGVAILAALLAFGDPGQVITLARSFQHVYLLFFLLALAAYEAVRCAQWHFMLTALGIRVPWRTQVFTFIAGEVTRDLPAGNFIPDYLLRQSHGTDFGLASSATLMITLLEVAVCLCGVVIIGIDDWNWLRPLVIVGVFAFTLLAWAFYRWHHQIHPLRWRIVAPVLRRQAVRAALDEVRQFLRGEASLLQPHVLAIGGTLAAVYLVLGGTALYLTTRGLGLGGISWMAALVVYFFSIAVAAIVPLPMDFGSIEVSAVGVLVVLGASRSGSVSAVLLNRVLNLGATAVIALVCTLALRGELLAALRGRRGVDPPVPPQAAGSTAPASSTRDDAPGPAPFVVARAAAPAGSMRRRPRCGWRTRR
jgi:uncharacterized protein (TIRG00374 family)